MALTSWDKLKARLAKDIKAYEKAIKKAGKSGDMQTVLSLNSEMEAFKLILNTIIPSIMEK